MQLVRVCAEPPRMPMGYESLVGDMSMLSGGQKQQGLLARPQSRRSGRIV
jgi:ABC-type bacteriocin/lantibiotic exporter with double-glycine peptidase domain